MCRPFSSYGNRNDANTKFYMPESREYGNILSMNIEFLIRFETNLKLNLIDKEGNNLV